MHPMLPFLKEYHRIQTSRDTDIGLDARLVNNGLKELNAAIDQLGFNVKQATLDRLQTEAGEYLQVEPTESRYNKLHIDAQRYFLRRFVVRALTGVLERDNVTVEGSRKTATHVSNILNLPLERNRFAFYRIAKGTLNQSQGHPVALPHASYRLPYSDSIVGAFYFAVTDRTQEFGRLLADHKIVNNELARRNIEKMRDVMFIVPNFTEETMAWLNQRRMYIFPTSVPPALLTHYADQIVGPHRHMIQRN